MTDQKSRLDLLSDMIEEGLSDSTVKFFVGSKYLNRNEQKRRAVWTRSQQTSRVEINARNSGGQKFGADEKPSKGNAVVDSLTETREVQGLLRVEAAELHIYAETERSLDDLWDAFLAVFRKNPATITLRENQGITYVIQELESETQRQSKLTALIYFKIPVATETKKLVKIVSVVHTCSLDV